MRYGDATISMAGKQFFPDPHLDGLLQLALYVFAASKCGDCCTEK